MKIAKTSPKHVFTSKIVLIESKLETSYNKFQKWVAKRLKLVLADTHIHVFRIDYKGHTRLKKGMLLMTERGVLLSVIDEQNRQAILVTVKPMLTRPRLNGKLKILEAVDTENINKNQK